MGQAAHAEPVLLVAAVFSRHAELIDASVERLAAEYGPILERSPRWPFTQTRYYEASMGADLLKELVAFEPLVDPGELVAAKLATNALEEQAAAEGRHPEARPVNIDPGYLAASKFVLATTKDYSHRLYLGRGIYAEVTLQYTGGRFEAQPWTYPDYRARAYHDFLDGVRRQYLDRLKRSARRLSPEHGKEPT